MLVVWDAIAPIITPMYCEDILFWSQEFTLYRDACLTQGALRDLYRYLTKMTCDETKTYSKSEDFLPSIFQPAVIWHNLYWSGLRRFRMVDEISRNLATVPRVNSSVMSPEITNSVILPHNQQRFRGQNAQGFVGLFVVNNVCVCLYSDPIFVLFTFWFFVCFRWVFYAISRGVFQP